VVRSPVRTGVPPAENPFLHAVGRDLVDGQGNKVVLKGLCFGNDVWSNPSLPLTQHHGEEQYRLLRSLGMNAVRYYLNHALLEDEGAPFTYKESGFEWLDRNFAWARASGVYLILNVHVPPGGFQSNGGGKALWRERKNQERLVALWREIARRYQDEPALAGYDLLNEPVVADDPVQWEDLANEALVAIRQVDRRHAIFVERLNAVIGHGSNPDWNEDRNGEMNFFLLDDTNVVYEFHFYKPMAFTHQGASWIPALRDLRTAYPGPFRDWDGARKTGDRAYLERELAPYLAFGKQHDVPLYLGEFGVIRGGFADGKSGTAWVGDVVDVALGAGVSFTYHDLHEDAFGLYAVPASEPPARLNHPLADLFAKKLR
jgi:aryl-phospho-beta-D-glucosidase BglC (GH1 family)